MVQGSRSAQALAQRVAKALPEWGRSLAFSQICVADADVSSSEPGLLAWLSAGCHGTMDYMARHGVRRARPAEVFKGTLRVITARMDYLPRGTPEGWQAAEQARLLRPGEAVVSVYARGRDRPLRPPRLHRHRPGDGGGAGHARRPGLARQAHAGAVARGWLDVLSGRAAGHPAVAAARARHRPLRPVPRLPGRLSHAGLPGPLPAGCAALHLLPADRARRADQQGPAAPERQPPLRLRRLPAGLPLEQVRAAGGAGGLRRARALGRARPAGAVALGRADLRPAQPGQRDPGDRLAALAPQPGGGQRQRDRGRRAERGAAASGP